MAKANKSNERYFFVAYSWIGDNTYTGFGNATFGRTNFFNNSQVRSDCESIVKKEFNHQFKKVDIVITNWIEMSKEDYETFRG